ncbi:hypothetical protein TKK_0013328 [Trichogramma kaykai]
MTGKKQGILHPIPPNERPFQIIHIDHIGPLVTSSKRNKYFLVYNFTKYVILEPCRDTKSDQVIKILENFCIHYGAPDRIISDRGTCFTSRSFEDFCKRHGIRHTLNSPRHAQANGQVERVNTTLVPVLQAMNEKDNDKHWDS